MQIQSIPFEQGRMGYMAKESDSPLDSIDSTTKPTVGFTQSHFDEFMRISVDHKILNPRGGDTLRGSLSPERIVLEHDAKVFFRDKIINAIKETSEVFKQKFGMEIGAEMRHDTFSITPKSK